MEENKFSNKQIANWRRIRVNIESDLNSLKKIEDKIEAEINKHNEKLAKLNKEYEEIQKMIDLQEYPVKMATGYTSQQLFIKETVVSDKVASDGRTIKKTVYNFVIPEQPINTPATDIEEHNEVIY